MQLPIIQNPEIPFSLQNWLLHPGSFIKKLKKYDIDHPEIQVLQQSWQFPFADERKQLALNVRTYALVREVLIKNGDITLMYARTVIPRTTLTGKQQQLARLKKRSLGSILFKDPTIQRSDFEIALLDVKTQWHEKVSHAAGLTLPELWARHSVFHVRGKPLLLTEVFMPAIQILGVSGE